MDDAGDAVDPQHPTDDELGSPAVPRYRSRSGADSPLEFLDEDSAYDAAGLQSAEADTGPEAYTREVRTTGQLMARAVNVSKRYHGKILPEKVQAIVSNIGRAYLVRGILSTTIHARSHDPIVCLAVATGAANVRLLATPPDRLVLLQIIEHVGMACSSHSQRWYRCSQTSWLGREAEHDGGAAVDIGGQQVRHPRRAASGRRRGLRVPGPEAVHGDRLHDRGDDCAHGRHRRHGAAAARRDEQGESRRRVQVYRQANEQQREADGAAERPKIPTE